ncbi:hypothetical protein [Enhygromyxa salina]|uniref:Uncharacterized protein n=1 Tax=Enhygromyxa salina TaxID=215803 RepID=A0A2S9XU67_9BACT|nr:hypothetical protein [Enhygromyxa salina]PRP96406.1 hypothetical protein ENSA7_72210 [Enhygromyxa salina]
MTWASAGVALRLLLRPLVAFGFLALLLMYQVCLTVDALFVLKGGAWFAIPYTELTEPRLRQVDEIQVRVGVVALAAYGAAWAIASFGKILHDDEKINPLAHLACAAVLGLSLIASAAPHDALVPLHGRGALALALAGSIAWWVWGERRTPSAYSTPQVIAWGAFCLVTLSLEAGVRVVMSAAYSITSSGRLKNDNRWVGGVYEFGRQPGVDCISWQPDFPVDGDSFLFVTADGRATDDPSRAVVLDPGMARRTMDITPTVELEHAVETAVSLQKDAGGDLRRLLLIGDPESPAAVVREIGLLAAKHEVMEILLLQPDPSRVETGVLGDVLAVGYCAIGERQPSVFSDFEGESLLEFAKTQ